MPDDDGGDDDNNDDNNDPSEAGDDEEDDVHNHIVFWRCYLILSPYLCDRSAGRSKVFWASNHD